MAFEEIKAGLEKYHAEVEAKLVKNPERANLVPNRLYTPVDLGENFDYMTKLGFPGEYPYTRGVQPTMYIPSKTRLYHIVPHIWIISFNINL